MGEPVTEPEDEPNMQETINQSEYWEFDPDLNFEKYETVTIPKNLVRFLWNISGSCTDTSEKGLYKNRKAMFEALDIIYKALDEHLESTKSLSKPKEMERKKDERL